MNVRDRISAQEALDRVAASRIFTRAGRLKLLLQHVVSMVLAGRRDALKETEIASAFYEKRGNYDPTENSTVRVEIGRLRMKLQKYYETEGLEDPIIINIPVGGYCPEFQPRHPSLIERTNLQKNSHNSSKVDAATQFNRELASL